MATTKDDSEMDDFIFSLWEDVTGDVSDDELVTVDSPASCRSFLDSTSKTITGTSVSPNKHDGFSTTALKAETTVAKATEAVLPAPFSSTPKQWTQPSYETVLDKSLTAPPTGRLPIQTHMAGKMVSSTTNQHMNNVTNTAAALAAAAATTTSSNDTMDLQNLLIRIIRLQEQNMELGNKNQTLANQMLSMQAKLDTALKDIAGLKGTEGEEKIDREGMSHKLPIVPPMTREKNSPTDPRVSALEMKCKWQEEQLSKLTRKLGELWDVQYSIHDLYVWRSVGGTRNRTESTGRTARSGDLVVVPPVTATTTFAASSASTVCGTTATPKMFLLDCPVMKPGKIYQWTVLIEAAGPAAPSTHLELGVVRCPKNCCLERESDEYYHVNEKMSNVLATHEPLGRQIVGGWGYSSRGVASYPTVEAGGKTPTVRGWRYTLEVTGKDKIPVTKASKDGLPTFGRGSKLHFRLDLSSPVTSRSERGGGGGVLSVKVESGTELSRSQQQQQQSSQAGQWPCPYNNKRMATPRDEPQEHILFSRMMLGFGSGTTVAPGGKNGGYLPAVSLSAPGRVRLLGFVKE